MSASIAPYRPSTGMPKRYSMRAIPSGVIASELKAIIFGSQTSIERRVDLPEQRLEVGAVPPDDVGAEPVQRIDDTLAHARRGVPRSDRARDRERAARDVAG